jgi:hypothetical protein
MPTYNALRSKKNGKVVIPMQMRGIEWLSAEGKATFKKKHKKLLARWGRNGKHVDNCPCLLIPADWGSLEPLEIMELLKSKKFPGGSEARLVYLQPILASSTDSGRHLNTKTTRRMLLAPWPGIPSGLGMGWNSTTSSALDLSSLWMVRIHAITKIALSISFTKRQKRMRIESFAGS